MDKKLLVILLVIVVLVSGCTTEKDTTPSKKEPFIGGTTGLLLDFAKDSPPEAVYDGGDFPFEVVVKLKNDGEHEIPKEDVEVRISGIRAEEFDLTEADLTKNPEEDLVAMKKDPEGKITKSPVVYVEFPNFNHREELTGNTPFTFRADVCYVYETTANAQLCVREDNLETEEGVCEVNEDKKVYNSGSPVQVTTFKEAARAKNKVSFTFDITHKGNGNIYRKETKCESERKNEDVVWVSVEAGIDGELKCSGLSDGTDTEGYAKLYEGTKPIICTQETDTENDYETPVVIKIKYDYKENKETEVLVKHTVNE